MASFLMDYHEFHRLAWLADKERKHETYRREGFEVVLPPEVMHTDQIAQIEDWLRQHCRGRWSSLVRFTMKKRGLACYDTFLRFADPRDAVQAKLRWA